MNYSNLDEQIKKQFGSWTAFSLFHKRNQKNFKRTFKQNIDKINSWLAPLGLEIQIVLKKQKRSGKKEITVQPTDDD